MYTLSAPWNITTMPMTQEDKKKTIGISYVLESCWFKNTNEKLSKKKTQRNILFSIYYFDVSMYQLNIIMV